MLMFAIVTNIAVSGLMFLLNGRFSLVILQEMVAIINQKGGGKLVNNLSYIFLTKMGILLLAILASGASPLVNFALLGLNYGEYKYIMSNFKQKKLFIIF